MVEEDCLNQLPFGPANWYTRQKTAIGKTTPGAQNPNQAKATTFDEDDKMDGHCFFNLNKVNCLIYIKYTHFIHTNIYRCNTGQPFGLYWTKSIQLYITIWRCTILKLFSLVFKICQIFRSRGTLLNCKNEWMVSWFNIATKLTMDQV